MHRDVGCIGIVVDSKPDAIAFYKKHGFIVIAEPDGEFGTTQMWLAFEAISEDN